MLVKNNIQIYEFHESYKTTSNNVGVYAMHILYQHCQEGTDPKLNEIEIRQVHYKYLLQIGAYNDVYEQPMLNDVQSKTQQIQKKGKVQIKASDSVSYDPFSTDTNYSNELMMMLMKYILLSKKKKSCISLHDSRRP